TGAPVPALTFLRASTGFCCAVGGHPSADTINRELRAGGQGNSVRNVADRWGISKSTVGDHKRLHLGISKGKATPDAPADIAPDSPDAADPSDSGSARADGTSHAATDDPPDTAPKPSGASPRAQQQLVHAKEALDERQRLDAQRIALIADMVGIGAWGDRPT